MTMESRNSAEEKNLAEKKSELLSLLLAEQGFSTSSMIPSRKKTSLPIPLAYEQEQLWLQAQLEPSNPFYHISLVLTLDGPLQVHTLEASLKALLERHESLRTCFHATDGRPFQVIAPSVTLSLPVVDLSASGQVEQDLIFEQV